MLNTHDLKQWSRSLLMVIAAAGCQSGEPEEDPAADPDVSEALSALPDARVLTYASDGVPEFVVGELGKISAAHEVSDLGGDASLRSALGPVLKVFRLTNDDLVLRKINIDEQGARHYRYAQRHQGLDVIGGDLVVHVDVKGAITGANGSARGGAAPAPGEVALAYGAADAGIAGDARWADVGARRIGGGRMVYVLEGGALRRAYERIVMGTRGADRSRTRSTSTPTPARSWPSTRRSTSRGTATRTTSPAARRCRARSRATRRARRAPTST